jgi:hypothetical protein
MRNFTSASTWRESTHDGWTLKKSNRTVVTSDPTTPIKPTTPGRQDFRSKHGKCTKNGRILQPMQQNGKAKVRPIKQLAKQVAPIYRKDIRSTDIVLGRGPDGTAGELFEPILSEWCEAYSSATRFGKRNVCRAALDELYDNGARFLRRVTDQQCEVVYYVEEPRDSPKIIDKIMRLILVTAKKKSTIGRGENELENRLPLSKRHGVERRL